MVYYLHVEKAASFAYLFGDPDICIAGMKTARGMIMAQQQLGGIYFQGFAEDNPRIHDSAGHPSNTEAMAFEYFVGVAQVHHMKRLMWLVGKQGLKKERHLHHIG